MKKCLFCGAQNSDASLFCTRCGKELPQGNKCPYCGASIYYGDNFCQNCGHRIESTINSRNSRVPLRVNNAQLHIKWIGQWFLFDSKVSVCVNGIKQGDYSMKDGFEIVVPITSHEMVVETKHALFHKTCKALTLNTSESYTYELVYNFLSGGFGSILYDNEGNEIEPFKVNWGWVLFGFLFPYAPIWILSVNKKHRKSFKKVLIASYLGWLVCFLILLFFFGFMFYKSNNFPSSKKDKVIVDSETTYKEIVDTVIADTVIIGEEKLVINSDAVMDLFKKKGVEKSTIKQFVELSNMTIVNEIEEYNELLEEWEGKVPFQIIYAVLSGKNVIQKDVKDEWGERKYSLVEDGDNGYGVVVEGESDFEDHNHFWITSVRLGYTFREEAEEMFSEIEAKGDFKLTNDDQMINDDGHILDSYQENKLHWVVISHPIEH